MQELQPIQPGIKANLKYDIPAGIVVFLVALPLCLGIALASEAPLFSGIITGIVAGLLVSILSDSELSVSGPAAGLTVIVAGAIASAGGYQNFLAAVVLSGVLQIIMAYVRAGVIANLFPVSVIKGMLAAIGIIIVLKQIPHALGRDKDYEGDLAFFQLSDGENTFTEILRAFASLSPGAVVITLVCLFLLLTWDRPWRKNIKGLSFVPGSLVAVIVGTLLNEAFGAFYPSWQLLAADDHLVKLPMATDMASFLGLFSLPNWSAFGSPFVWKSAIVIAIIGSIETLLCLEATQKLDPFHRIADPNKELRAQGVGNLLAGMIGGLPMTSVIVRSSTNVYSGGRTRSSAFIHGALLFLTVLCIPGILNRIPLAALAAILFSVGYKLARVDMFRSMYRAGMYQFLPFIITILAIIFTDLLVGVMLGLCVGIANVVIANFRTAIIMVSKGDTYLVKLSKDCSFLNKMSLNQHLKKIPAGASVIIDGTSASFIDHDVVELIDDFVESSKFRDINVRTRNIDHKKSVKPKGVGQSAILSKTTAQ